jgi:hypothetical protein
VSAPSTWISDPAVEGSCVANKVSLRAQPQPGITAQYSTRDTDADAPMFVSIHQSAN